MSHTGTSFEPLLERYIGHRVILELIKGDKLLKYSGVLKSTVRYTNIKEIAPGLIKIEDKHGDCIILPLKNIKYIIDEDIPIKEKVGR